MVLHITSPEAFTVELTGGDAPVQDGEYFIFRITDPATQTIKITYGETTQDIDLGGVTGD